jgi:hypothetical protein
LGKLPLPVWGRAEFQGGAIAVGRLLLAAGLIYCAGFSAFDDLRPVWLDRPLKVFHRTVDAAFSDGGRAIAVIDDARRLPSLQTLTSRWPRTF